MTKTQQLFHLFDEWKHEPHFKENDFHEDGIINEELFEQNPVGKKILFIAKEPNAKGKKPTDNRSFVEEWNSKDDPPTYKVAQRIAEWTCCIMNDFPPYEQLENKLSYLRKIAFMNVKKSGGGSITDNRKMYKIVKPQCKFILKEVNIIEPDIIVASLSFAEPLIKDIFGKVTFINSGYNDIKIGKYNKSKIISFYHPSSRKAPVDMYNLLQNVVRLDAFQHL